jgi:prepilin-type N-terminal cleavage/methylation domain-containing protein
MNVKKLASKDSSSPSAIGFRNDSGFSLVELIAVTVILVIMSGILFGTWKGIVQGSKLVENQRITIRQAQFVLARMINELSGRVLEPLSAEEQSEESSSVKSSGQYIRGIDEKIGDVLADRITFVSSNAGQAHFGKNVNYGLVEIEYRLEEDNSGGDLGIPLSDKSFVLVREEKPASVKDNAIIKARTIVFPLASNIQGLNFRYLSQGEWKEQWTEPASVLPEAVEITLILKGSEDSPSETYRTAVGLSKRVPR